MTKSKKMSAGLLLLAMLFSFTGHLFIGIAFFASWLIVS